MGSLFGRIVLSTVAAAAVLSPPAASSQGVADKFAETTVAVNTSQVRYNSLTHDFGKIKESGGAVSVDFEFTNVSKRPFLIEFVSVSCGCTTPEYSKAPVMPAGKGKITITYDPSGRPGVFSKEIVVTSNNRKDQVKLTITGEVIGKPRGIEDSFPVELGNGLRSTSTTFLFGYIARGKKATQSVDIYNNGTSPVDVKARILRGQKENAAITVTPSVIGPKEQGQISFTYDMAGADLWGVLNTVFEVSAGNKPSLEDFSAYATITEDFSVLTPEQTRAAARADFSSQFYHFDNVRRGDNPSHSFTITNSGKSPLIIRSIKPNSTAVTYSMDKNTIAPGDKAEITVTLLTGNTAGRVSESITIIMNDPVRPMREMRVAAVVN